MEKSRKKRICAAVIVMFLLLTAGAVVFSGVFMPVRCTGCDLSSVNSNARLLYTNSAVYSDLCEKQTKSKLPDGIYFGELVYKEPEFTETADKNGQPVKRYISDSSGDGTYSDYGVKMNELMGIKDGTAYYAAVFEDGIPVQTYYSGDKKIRRYYDKVRDSYERGTLTQDFCSCEDFGRIYVGGYPEEVYFTRETVELVRREDEKYRARLDADARDFLTIHLPEYTEEHGAFTDGVHRGEYRFGINETVQGLELKREPTEFEDYLYRKFKTRPEERPFGAFVFLVRDGEAVCVYWADHSESLGRITDEEVTAAYGRGERAEGGAYCGYADIRSQ